MLKILLALMANLFLSAFTEGPAWLDMSSQESYRNCLHEMKAGMYERHQARLDVALSLVRVSVLREMDHKMLTAVFQDRSGDVPKLVFEVLQEKLNGKKAQRVLELAHPEFAAFDRGELPGRVGKRAEEHSNLLVEAMIADTRGSIEASDDQTLKEQWRKELQSLLKFREDRTKQDSKSIGGWHSAGGFIPSDDWYSTELVAINLGDYGYVVPRNFVSHIVWSGSKDNHQHAVLNALWPGLEPRTKENKRAWRFYDKEGVKRAEWNGLRQITINLAPPGYLASDGYRIFQNATRNLDTPPGQVTYGLTPYKTETGVGPKTYYVAEGHTYRNPQNTPLVLQCEEATDGIQELFDVKMRCKVEYILEDGIGLSYDFHANDLEDWKERDTAVRQLITSFRAAR